MLKRFVGEQAEKEATAQGSIDARRLVGGNGSGIYTLDKEPGALLYTPVTAG